MDGHLEPKLDLREAVLWFDLSSSQGGNVKLPDCRQRFNMVIFFFCGSKRGSVRILRDFKDNYEKYAALKTRVLAVSTEDREELGKLADELNLPFPLFSDTSLEMTSKYTYLDSTTKCPMPSVFITDRFAALYEQRIAEREVDLPDQEEILDWLHFIAMQCPECGVDARINERLVG